MNQLHLGFDRNVAPLDKGFLYLADEIPEMKWARKFDYTKHHLNPLSGITYKKARNLSAALYSLTLQGETTLARRDGERALLRAFLHSRRFDRLKFPTPRNKSEERGNEDAQALIDDLLQSPVLKAVFCTTTNFTFDKKATILARINRAELGDFDALVLSLVLINHFQGQIIVPDFGFYGRDVHISLVRENRIIAGVNHLAELPLRLRNALLLVKDKRAHGVLYDDAVLLARLKGFVPGTNRFNDAVDDAMA